MAFSNMIQEMLGIPGMNLGLAKTFLNEAFTAIQNEQTWSFQLQIGGWLTPGLLGSPSGYGTGGYGVQVDNQSVGGPTSSFDNGSSNGIPSPLFLSPGTITIAPYTNTLLGDAVATQAWLAQLFTPPLITQYQFRVPYYSLYSATALQFAGTVAYLEIVTNGSGQTPGTYLVMGTGGSGAGAIVSITVGSDGTVSTSPIVVAQGNGYAVGGVANPPTFTLAAGGTSATFNVVLNAIILLDRPWMEPNQFLSPYMAYQAYFPAPAGFKRWFNIRDTVNNNSMDFWSKTQIDLANDDAERTIFDQPYYVVPYGIDMRPGSATLGQQLVELWPGPITELPYTFNCLVNWPPLVNAQDTIPYPLTEELVKFRAKESSSLFKESQKGDEMERGSGANWQFLAKAYREEYNDRLKDIRIMDRHLIELYFTKARNGAPYGGEPFSTINGQLNVGWM
jgi:hypothetical protein